MGDQIVNIDLAIHVPIHNLRHIRPPLRTAKRSALPNPPRHQLKRARRNLLSCAGDANNDAFAPTLVTALQGLSHDFRITDAFERVVHTAIGEIHNGLYGVVHIIGVDKIRHTKPLSQRLTPTVQVDTDNPLGPRQTGPLNNIQPNAPQTEYGHRGAGFYLCCIHHRTDSSGDAAADVTHLVKRRI